MKLTIEIEIIGKNDNGEFITSMTSNINGNDAKRISPPQIRYLIEAEKRMFESLKGISLSQK